MLYIQQDSRVIYRKIRWGISLKILSPKVPCRGDGEDHCMANSWGMSLGIWLPKELVQIIVWLIWCNLQVPVCMHVLAPVKSQFGLLIWKAQVKIWDDLWVMKFWCRRNIIRLCLIYKNVFINKTYNIITITVLSNQFLSQNSGSTNDLEHYN